MKLYSIVFIFVILAGNRTFAQKHDSNVVAPQLSVQQSNYISFQSSNVNVLKGAVLFEGNFIVLGEGIYGHFDMVGYNDSGKVISKTMTENRAWQRDRGGKLKTIALSMNIDTPTKVEVSFHEMRLSSGVGACKQ